ncbi:MAG: aspartate aminotransferase family protein [Rhizobiaceae bacterium]|nr:aspartate aminotransferase family protein [Rhizobiaceae bacterium]
MGGQQTGAEKLRFVASKKAIKVGAQYVAGGVNSHFRIGMMPHPLVFTHGDGAYLFDVDGNKIIDYYCGMGAAVLGHSPRSAISAYQAQVARGILFAGQSQVEYEAARLLCEAVPSAQRVRFGSSGSEVVQAAFRVARGATGRTRIIKFEGHYHGWFDNVLWSTAPSIDQAGPAEAPIAVAGSRGQLSEAQHELVILGWNDLNGLRARLAKGDIAAVVMEPAMCNQGAISPDAGFLEGARAACTEYGSLLIFDEVITGFRLSKSGGQGLFGVTPDLSVFAKAIANGFPVSALVGSVELMELVATGGVLHGGTFNSQPAAMAAMIAVQNELTEDHYRTASERGLRLQAGVRDILKDTGIKAYVGGFPLVFHVALGLDAPPRNYRDLTAADRLGYVALANALLRRGVRVLERGAWFVSAAHDDTVIDRTLETLRDAAREVAPRLAA